MSIENIKESLLQSVTQLENAAKKCTHSNAHNDIPKGKVISSEQCEWILKDCTMFRRFITLAFEEQLSDKAQRINKCEYKKIIELMSDKKHREKTKATSKKIASSLGIKEL